MPFDPQQLPPSRVHVFGFDHDGSVGEAAHYDAFGVLFKVISYILSADLANGQQLHVYVADDSLRQDRFLDDMNVILNATVDTLSPANASGSVFLTMKKMQRYLAQLLVGSVKQVDLLKTVTADLFPECWWKGGANPALYYDYFFDRVEAAYQGKIRLPFEKFLALQRHLKGDAAQGSVAEEFNLPDYCELESHTHYDESKFSNIWLKAQEVANRQPDEIITYHFFDDKEEYGYALLKLFNKHPTLLPKNVVFVFHDFKHNCDGTVEATAYSPSPIGDGAEPIYFVRGTGMIHQNYKALARNFMQAAVAILCGDPIGVDFNGVESIEEGYIFSLEAGREAVKTMMQPAEHTAQAAAAAPPTPISTPSPPSTSTSKLLHIPFHSAR